MQQGIYNSKLAISNQPANGTIANIDSRPWCVSSSRRSLSSSRRVPERGSDRGSERAERELYFHLHLADVAYVSKIADQGHKTAQ